SAARRALQLLWLPLSLWERGLGGEVQGKYNTSLATCLVRSHFMRRAHFRQRAASLPQIQVDIAPAQEASGGEAVGNGRRQDGASALAAERPLVERAEDRP